MSASPVGGGSKTRSVRVEPRGGVAGRTIAQLMDLTDRRALVTGGAGHLGRVVADTLVELGATVVVSDRDEATCRTVAESLCRRRADAAIGLVSDLTDESATRALARDTAKRLGGLDIVVHCAAHVGAASHVKGWAVPFEQQTIEAWDMGLRVNLTAPFIIAQEAREALARSGHGSIILVGSIYGVVAPDHRLYAGTSMAHPGAYSASKGGITQLTRYLASTLAPRVRVNAVSPGGIWRQQPEVFRERYEARTPLARMAVEEDMKGAIAYLASDLSAYVTGQNLLVDGGWTVW